MGIVEPKDSHPLVLEEECSRAAPRVHAYCRCGAQWHGKYATDTAVIAVHAARLLNQRCGLITRDEFETRWQVKD